MENAMNLSESRLMELVPDRAGLFFVGCPNCTGGLQENQLKSWSPDEPDVVRCRYCGMAYPNEVYKDDKVEEVLTPGGKMISYPYYENKDGYRYYFTAAREFNKRDFCERLAHELALKWKETKDISYGRKSALILYRFAQVWPNYCWHFDYPFIQKQWYQGYVAPKDCRPGYRTARYHWWGYIDLDKDLLSAYEIIKDGDFWDELDKEYQDDLRAKIEWFFRDNADHLIARKTDLGNMHPYLWRPVVQLGRILKEIKYIHYPIPDLKRLISENFFADGTWNEGSPDYTSQTLGGIVSTCEAFGDWKDPVDYVPSESDLYLDGTNVKDLFPEIKRAEEALEKLKFPFGGGLTIHDSWGHSEYPYPDIPDDYTVNPFLLPALGHGCMAGGKGAFVSRVDLTWSGGYGHQHMDGLSLMVTAYGREMLSDLGYTHTKFRCWTLATLAHNTVVVDNKTQHGGGKDHPTDGNCRFFYDKDPIFQTLSVDNPQAYPNLVDRYTRSLARVQTEGDRFYILDLFRVKGGSQHDYILHGDCISEQAVLTDETLKEKFSPVETLLPEGAEYIPPTGEHQTGYCFKYGYAYGFMSQIKEADIDKEDWNTFTLKYTGLPIGPKNDNMTVDEKESRLGIRIHSYHHVHDRLFTGVTPSVRQGKNNDDLLDQYLHPFVMVRRNPEEEGSSFCTVMEPFEGKAKIRRIQKVYLSGDGVILKILWDDVTDVVFFNIKEKQTILSVDGSGSLTVKGAYGFARIKEGNLQHATVSCGSIEGFGESVASENATVCPLEKTELEIEESIVTVYDPNGLMNPEKNDTVILRRDNRLFGYKVLACCRKGEKTEIRIQGWLGFTFDPRNNRSVDLCFPQRTYTGDHEVIWMPVKRKESGKGE